MSQPLTSDQINQLESLGIEIKKESPTEDLKIKNFKPKKLTSENRNLKSPIFPLLSISGLTILSFSGLILLKGKTQNTNSSENRNLTSDISPSPTQVPKSIQHYLLTSQQYFSQALQLQKQPSTSTTNNSSSTIDLLNNSILAATSAIKEFPQDYRGYLQRAQIYQSLVDSKPEFLVQAISDLNTSYKLNSNSSEITHLLASLYAKKGDVQNTLAFLNQTIIIEPTKAQNFYDLAKIQQQAGLLPQALQTYNQLLTLVSDSTQKTQITSEKLALEKLVAQNPNAGNNPALQNPSTIDNQTSTIDTKNLDSPLIQALADTSLIVAAPETENKVEISNQTESNSLAGNSTLSSGQKQIVITNTNISSSSQVYVTITKGGKNQNLQVLSKSNGSFTVGLDSPINETIEFKWWIIN